MALNDINAREKLWREVVYSIEDLAVTGCYEKVNNIMSLGRVKKLREKTIRLLGNPESLLDAGCGPGTSTIVALSLLPRSSKIYMLDPSIKMLKYAYSRFSLKDKSRLIPLAGVFENIPLEDNTVDAITAMFSFRDAANFESAVVEFYRILKKGGKIAILDIYRPGGFMLSLVEAYFRIIVPIALVLSRCSRKLVDYKSFIKTIKEMLTLDDINKLFKKYFNKVNIYKLAPGLGIIYAEK